jgi:hypothetical protein
MAKIPKKNLDRLEEQRAKLNHRILLLRNRLKSSESKKDTRKKILVGAYFLDTAIKEDKMDEIKSAMAKFLTRNSDRDLFDLEPIPEKTRKLFK